MCDENDDERMRAFWRALAEREEVAKLSPESEFTDADPNPIVQVWETIEPKRTKPRALLH